MVRGALLGTAMLVLAAGEARAGSPADACTQGYEGAQKLMRAGALLRSRADLTSCEKACPKALAADCRAWRVEVGRRIPSLRLSAREADGSDPGRVRVLVDGAPLLESLDGAPIEIDPGRHLLTFETSTRQRVEVLVDVPEGRKDYAVDVRFPPRPAPRPPPRSRAPLILGGIGLAALGAGGILGIKGQLDRRHLVDTCAPHCRQASVDAIGREWTIGAIVGAAGGAATLAAALWWTLEGRGDRRSGPRPDKPPAPR